MWVSEGCVYLYTLRTLVVLSGCGLVDSVFYTLDRQISGSNLPRARALSLSPHAVVHGWVNKGLGMPSRVCPTGHVKDPVSLIAKMLQKEASLLQKEISYMRIPTVHSLSAWHERVVGL